MAQNVGRLGVVLGLDTAEFVKGLGNATVSLSKFVDKMKPALAVGAAAMTGLIAKTVAYADEVSDLADANNLAISTVMALGSALAVSGGKAENAGKLIAAFTAKIDNAAEGNKQAQKSFERLGISLSDIANLSNEQLLDKVIKKLSEIKDPVARNALAMETLGKAAKNINWAQMGEELANAKEKYKDAEAGIRAMGDAADSTQRIYKTFIAAIAVGVGEDLKTTVEYLEKVKGLAEGVGTVFRVAFETIAVLASDVAFVVERTFALLNTALDFSSMRSAKARKEAWDAYHKDSERLRAELDAYQKKVLTNEPSKKAEDTSTPNGKRPVKDADAETLTKQKAISDEFAKQQKQRLDAIVMQGEMVAMTERQKEIYEAVAKIEKDRDDKLADIDQKIKEAQAGDAGAKVIEGLEAQKLKVLELSEAYIGLTQKAIQANEMRVRSQQILTNTEKQGFDAMVNNFEVLGKQSKKAFDAWKAFSIMNTIIDTYSGAQKAFTSMAGIPFIGPALGVAAAAAAIGAGMARVQAIRSMQYQGRAKGGTVVGNTPYMVGEDGPELVIPQRSANVIPNNQLSSALGGMGGGITYNGPYIANLSAIDTQSATQFIADNKKAIWSANLSAQRSVPTFR